MSGSERATAVRRGAGLFRLDDRGLVAVRGDDARDWLNRMLSNDVSGLEPEGPVSGVYALLLTTRGGIVADLHVMARLDGFWLETGREAVGAVLETLGKLVVADDVELEDRSGAFSRFALEGPAAPAVVEGAVGRALALSPDGATEVRIADAPAVVAAFGWSGLPAFQLFVPPADAERVESALLAAGAPVGLVRAEPDTLEGLRVEAGIPRLGAELDRDVLPAEAHLDHAVSHTKGCYVGQEIVARVRTRGSVNHLLVGLSFGADVPPAVGTQLRMGERKVGEVTSVARSARLGAIGLGFVRREHSEPGSPLDADGVAATVRALGRDTGAP